MARKIKSGPHKMKGEKGLGRSSVKRGRPIYLVDTDNPRYLKAQMRFLKQESDDDYFTVIIISDEVLHGGDDTYIYSFRNRKGLLEYEEKFKNLKIPVNKSKLSIKNLSSTHVSDTSITISSERKFVLYVDRRFINTAFKLIDQWEIL